MILFIWHHTSSEFETVIYTLDTRIHRGRLAKSRHRTTNLRNISKSEKSHSNHQQDISNPNIQSDEAPDLEHQNNNFTVDINDESWIPYGDHRNAIEHGSGDIILLLDDGDEHKKPIDQV